MVFLPAGEGRMLDAGPSGWTATTHVTAVGCGPSGCPTAQATWTPDDGPNGVRDGALGGVLSGLDGQSGVATVVWRSPVFLLPPDATAATFSMATKAAIEGAVGLPASSVRARLVALGGGIPHTAVESAPSESSPAWTEGAPKALPLGALALGSLHRLEVELRFQFESGARGVPRLLFDRPTLAIERPRAMAPGSVVGPQPAPSSTGDVPDRADPGAGVSAADGPLAASPVRAGTELLARCAGEEVVVVGAGVLGSRLLLSGVASAPPGARLELLSADGWALGRTTLGADGTFHARLRVPAAAPRIRRVLARVAGGEQSPPTTVQRDHLLRGVRPSGRAVVIEGTLPRSAARGRIRLDVLVASDPCEPELTVPASKLSIDRKTGRYRAVASPKGAGAAPFSAAGGIPVVRAQATLWGPGLPRRVTTSQPILTVRSGIGLR